MVDESSKKRAKAEFVERLEKLCNKCVEDYNEVIKINGSLEEILKKSESYSLEHKKEWNKLEEFYIQKNYQVNLTLQNAISDLVAIITDLF